MSIPIEASIWIDKTPMEVFAFITNVSNWPLYMPGMIDAHLLDDGDPGVGTRIALKVAFLGSTIDVVTAWTRWEPGVALGSANEEESAMGTRMLTTLTEENGGTRMERVDELEPRRFLVHLAAPLIQRAVARNTRTEFENIKDMLENG